MNCTEEFWDYLNKQICYLQSQIQLIKSISGIICTGVNGLLHFLNAAQINIFITMEKMTRAYV